MTKNLTHAAALLAVMFILQSLRLIMPMPPIFSLFIFGTLANACLLLTVETTDKKGSIIVAILTPVIGFLQQALPFPAVFLPVAIFTNLTYIFTYALMRRINRLTAITASAVTRVIALYISSYWAFNIIDIPELQKNMLQSILSWPQLITSIAGGFLCVFLVKRIPIDSDLNITKLEHIKSIKK